MFGARTVYKRDSHISPYHSSESACGQILCLRQCSTETVLQCQVQNAAHKLFTIHITSMMILMAMTTKRGVCRPMGYVTEDYILIQETYIQYRKGHTLTTHKFENNVRIHGYINSTTNIGLDILVQYLFSVDFRLTTFNNFDTARTGKTIMVTISHLRRG